MSEAPQTPAFQPTPEYLARARRMDNAMHLRKPDRVPVAPLVVHFYATRIKGISNRDAMYEQDKAFAALKEATIRHGWDGAPSPTTGMRPARPWEILGVTQFKWPGNGLPDDQPFQWVEGEYMRQDEYDEMLANPNAFAVKKLWPRISTTLGPVSGIAQTPSQLVFLSNAYMLPGFFGGMLSQPPVMVPPACYTELCDSDCPSFDFKDSAIAVSFVTALLIPSS